MTKKEKHSLADFNVIPVVEDPSSLLDDDFSEIEAKSKLSISSGMEALQQSIERSKQRLLAADATAWSTEFSAAEIAALLNRMPYLQICNADLDVDYEHEIAFVRAKSGWLLHDYWNAIAASPGEHLYCTDMVAEDDSDEGGTTSWGGVGMPPGVGTIVQQGFTTAEQMIALAQQRGWKGVYLVDGHRRMKWAAWVAGQSSGVEVFGFEPTEQERDRLYRLRRNEATIDKLRVNMRSGPGRG